MMVALAYAELNKYGPKKGKWHGEVTKKQDTSIFWKGVLLIKHLVCHSLEYKLGKGSNIVFWLDRWC